MGEGPRQVSELGFTTQDNGLTVDDNADAQMEIHGFDTHGQEF